MNDGLALRRFSSFESYREAQSSSSEVLAARWLWGEYLGAACDHLGTYQGYCGLCSKRVDFTFEAKPGHAVNLREELTCSGCGLNARARVVGGLLKAACPPQQATRVYLTEQTTALYAFVRRHWSGAVGSEFFKESKRRRIESHMRDHIGVDQPLRFEDVTGLSFGDATFDAIVSCDVLEHVPDYKAAVKQFARVIKPGGQLILTVPFLDRSESTLVRARLMDDGSIEHLVEPEYHGDPLNPRGVLAYYHFGWDLLDVFRSVGFSSAAWCLPWSPAEAIFFGQWTLLATR